MIIAQDPAASRESVFIKVAGLLVLTQGMQIGGQILSTTQGRRVVIAQHSSPSGQGVVIQQARLLGLPSARRSRARLEAEHNVSGWFAPALAADGPRCPDGKGGLGRTHLARADRPPDCAQHATRRGDLAQQVVGAE